RRAVSALFSIDCERSCVDEIGEAVSRRKMVNLSVHRHPPLAVARLQSQALAYPTEVFFFQRIGHKPREPLLVVAPQGLPIDDLARMQQVNLAAVKDARVPIAQYVASKAHTTGAIGHNRAHRVDAILFPISDKAVTHQLHCSGSIGTKPEI